ncbi:hypothetical protein M231_06634 [Tremella mesenterica]|uniref:Uncharacterized protein n=1 Tax=Tremella mesenterica TaxID=5217 RepID=A0A4Q1BDK3_TREME|nr:hypothetical protein M231_06634 [Tremella mesenterica]
MPFRARLNPTSLTRRRHARQLWSSKLSPSTISPSSSKVVNDFSPILPHTHSRPYSSILSPITNLLTPPRSSPETPPDPIIDLLDQINSQNISLAENTYTSLLSSSILPADLTAILTSLSIIPTSEALSFSRRIYTDISTTFRQPILSSHKTAFIQHLLSCQHHTEALVLAGEDPTAPWTNILHAIIGTTEFPNALEKLRKSRMLELEEYTLVLKHLRMTIPEDAKQQMRDTLREMGKRGLILDSDGQIEVLRLHMIFGDWDRARETVEYWRHYKWTNGMREVALELDFRDPMRFQEDLDVELEGSEEHEVASDEKRDTRKLHHDEGLARTIPPDQDREIRPTTEGSVKDSPEGIHRITLWRRREATLTRILAELKSRNLLKMRLEDIIDIVESSSRANDIVLTLSIWARIIFHIIPLNLTLGKDIYHHVVSLGLHPSASLALTVIRPLCLSRPPMLEEALKILQTLPERSAPSLSLEKIFQVLLFACSRLAFPFPSTSSVSSLPLSSPSDPSSSLPTTSDPPSQFAAFQQPTPQSLSTSLSRKTASNSDTTKFAISTALHLLNQMHNLSLSLPPQSLTSIIILLMSSSPSHQTAFQLYSHFRSLSPIPFSYKDYTAILTCFLRLSLPSSPYAPPDLFFHLVRDMRQEGYRPGSEILASLLRSYALLARRLRKSPKYLYPTSTLSHTQSSQSSFFQSTKPNISTLSNLQHPYESMKKSGDNRSQENTFNEKLDNLLKAINEVNTLIKLDPNIEPTIPLLNSLLIAFSNVGAYEEALSVWDSLLLRRPHEDQNRLEDIYGTSVCAVLDTCGWAGLKVRAEKVWVWAGRWGVRGEKEWETWVECWCRLGRFEEAIKAVVGLKREPVYVYPSSPESFTTSASPSSTPNTVSIASHSFVPPSSLVQDPNLVSQPSSVTSDQRPGDGNGDQEINTRRKMETDDKRMEIKPTKEMIRILLKFSWRDRKAYRIVQEMVKVEFPEWWDELKGVVGR